MVVHLNRSYSILLADSESGNWTQEHAYRLLETMKTIPQEDQLAFNAESLRPSRWLITSEHVENDIRVTGGTGTDWTVLISEEAFVNASPRIALIEGKRGRYYSQRLHQALVRFVTDNGRDEDAYEKILQERFGVTTRITKNTTYEELTASTTGEGASRFQKFHADFPTMSFQGRSAVWTSGSAAPRSRTRLSTSRSNSMPWTECSRGRRECS